MFAGKEVWRAQQSEGPATILAIGTANPSNYIDQSTYTDYYFRVTNCEDKTELKDKFRLLCESSMIKKHHFFLTEDILKQNPNICQFDAPSLNARQEIAVAEVPKLGKEAALEAIKSWGQMKSEITHLIFCTNSGANMPGADYQLTKLLRLGPHVKRLLLYNQGWFAGGTTLRLAKDLAENNKGARVLVVCSEISAAYFHGPNELHDSLLAGMSLFGDGAVSLIVGSDPIPELEKPIYEIISASQRTIPDSDCQLIGRLRESGLMVDFSDDIYGLVPNSIEPILVELFKPLGISDWNSIFWVVHPGAVGILDQVEVKLGLGPDKLWASRHVLSEYGNMSSVTVLFVLDEMRKKSIKEGLETSGGGLEWVSCLGSDTGSLSRHWSYAVCPLSISNSAFI